jgi:hypothetical protein
MGFFSRGRPDSDPLVAFREPTVAADEPAREITGLLEELRVPFQRKGEAWLVEVGGAWATCGWIPRDATLAAWIDYMERPGPSTDLVRAQTETGLAAYEVTDGALMTKVCLPVEHLDRIGLSLVFAALAREAGGPGEQPHPDTPDHGVDAALGELGVNPGDAEVRTRGDLVEVRIALGPAAPEEDVAEWMLGLSGIWGSRLGLDEQGTLWSISAVPGRPATPGGLAWALAGARALAQHYRASV